MGEEKRTFKKKDMPIRRLHDNDEELDQAEMGGEFADLFQDSLRQPQSGEVVKAVVVQIEQDVVLVDVGYKSEGAIRIAEFIDENGELTVKVGDEVNVYFERGENIRGHMVLSKKKADSQVAWEAIAAAGEGGVIEGKITGKVKGGMTVDVGVEAFLPASQVDLRPGGNMDRFVGQTYQFRILKLNRKRGNLVLSRRVLLEEERDKARTETLATLKEGDIANGVVKNIAEYGAFVDLGGVDGLLHVTDMSWGRLGHPSEMVKVGDTLKVMVLKYDREKGKISLGLKQTVPDPWLNVAERYQEGERVRGKVVSLTDYGAFISLEDGIEGLVHVSEMSWTRRVRHPSEILKVGEEVEAVILGVDPGNRRISLGLKQTEVNPWTVIGERYPVGTKIEGQIKNITDFGVFIGIEDGIDGLVHVSDISWTRRVKHPGELFSKGQTVQAVVLNIDVENERLSLGIKQLVPDPWEEIPRKYKPGSKVKGKVTSVTDFGIFVEIEEGIEGLIHVSEISYEKVASPKDFANVGDELEAVVLNVDMVEKKIALSIKALQTAMEKAEMASYMGSQGEATSSFGDLLKEKLKKSTEE
ncbi:30S ribosomal protein S1 [Geomonas sp. Red69]|uniref:30S ribosomal protein S1 n=1 Tax=Geomonas diazotrophica TaxID=2843197 RepID=A0ABX8JML3_9BACT|nr:MULTISPECIES: 30S ribosomal protein S1 [Geomonas]MBU5636790.1 30S ribosomal protein S1 [Geomonas diazotrophica]QWV98401.1 30S ribosomal protein S1 [Geomonas nitrogeniifigens]QXE87583.1 30S ribosomal protein S1 [Geomonas nitrogeniifigens]